MSSGLRLSVRALLILSCLGLAACDEDKSANSSEAGGAAAPAKPAEAPKLPVLVETLTPRSIRERPEFSGRARAFQEAEIRPQTSGIIEQRYFEGGEQVEAGKPLFKIVDAEYQAALVSAKAAVRSAETQAKLAEDTAKRMRTLVRSGAVSRQRYETENAAYQQARANVDLQKSALAQAQINVDRTTVRAPISGTVGRPSVNIGALVTANQPNPLSIVSQLDPIYVDLTVPSIALLNYQQRVASGELTSNTGAVKADIVRENGSKHPHQAELQIVDARIEEGASTVIVRAVVPNPDGRLLPGAFLRAVLVGGIVENAITIPQSALLRNPRGEPTVYIVNGEGLLEQRSVELGASVDGRWVIKSGLVGGDRVVLNNLQKLRPGMPVNASAAPATSSKGQ